MIRPFAARVVRPDRPADVVIPMPDPLDETIPMTHWVADPTAYDDTGPALYVYRQRIRGRDHVGLVCELDVRAFRDGRVLGHEQVGPERVRALMRHHARTQAPPALVVLIHREGPVFRRTLEDSMREAPVLDFPGPGGAHQTVWRLPPGDETAALVEELAQARHYIADGHHRVSAALQRRDEGGGSGLLCVVHALEGLRLSAFHRRVSGPVDPPRLLDLLRPSFHVESVDGPPTPTPGVLGLRVGRRWHRLEHRGSRPEGTAGLDAALLQAEVLDQVAAAIPGPDVVPTRAPVEELVARCDSDGGALFTLAPPTLQTLVGLADQGALMPPKTTYFRPKPCAGIFLRPQGDATETTEGRREPSR